MALVWNREKIRIVERERLDSTSKSWETTKVRVSILFC